MITLEYSKAKIRKQSIEKLKDKIVKVDRILEEEAKKSASMAGWMFFPENISKIETERIKRAAHKINTDSEILIVIGIGGSYLGAKAILELLQEKTKQSKTEIIFVGTNMSTRYINRVIEKVMEKDFSINVISKSGTTTEPGIAFRIFRELLIQKYGVQKARERIFVTTDPLKGALKQLSVEEAYETFEIPENIGGRYSVLTAVGLLPLAVGGIDIDKLLEGAKKALDEYLDEDLLNNQCYIYAVLRYLLHSKYGKDIELFASFEPDFEYFMEWLKQLFNESEGKDGKGIFSCSAIYSTDLHSIGQYIQEGKRNIFETVISVNDMQEKDIVMKEEEGNEDGLNYLAGKTLDEINNVAMKATIDAHFTGDVPVMKISIEKLDEENIGRLIYFFEKACAVHGLLLEVNPFNQPGVEAYKNNMFKLLGKPGYNI